MGMTLSESHSSHMEMMLTSFVVSEMGTEGSTFYRSEATTHCGPNASESKRKNASGEEGQPPKAKAKAKGKAKAKNQPKSTREPNEEVDEDAEPEETEDAGGHGDTLPW